MTIKKKPIITHPAQRRSGPKWHTQNRWVRRLIRHVEGGWDGEIGHLIEFVDFVVYEAFYDAVAEALVILRERTWELAAVDADILARLGREGAPPFDGIAYCMLAAPELSPKGIACIKEILARTDYWVDRGLGQRWLRSWPDDSTTAGWGGH